MRKQDYANLAAIIRDVNRLIDTHEMEYAHGHSTHERAVLVITARQFAQIASVNKDEFLKACGIK